MPKQWYRLKSPDRFKHVKEMNLHSNTLEFLDETQKYIHLISHPLHIDEHLAATQHKTVIPKSPKPVKSHRPASPTPARTVRTPEFPVMSREEATNLFNQLNDKKVSRDPSPSLLKGSLRGRSAVRKIQKSKTEERLHEGSSYLVTTYSMPRVLTSNRPFTRAPIKMRNNKIQAFLDRFDSLPKERLVFNPQSPKGSKITSPKAKLRMLTLKHKQAEERLRSGALAALGTSAKGMKLSPSYRKDESTY